MTPTRTQGRIACALLCFALASTPLASARYARRQQQSQEPEHRQQHQQPQQSRQRGPQAEASLLPEAARLLQEGRPDAAEPLLRRAIRLAPLNADAHNLLGAILDQRGETPEAEREYREALRLNPKGISARANLGVLLARTKRLEEAVRLFQSVLSIEPDHPQATLNLGLALYNLNRHEEARRALEAAASLLPGMAEPLYYLGLIASARGETERAVAYWQRALALRADYTEASFMLAEELRKSGRLEDAEGFYERALEGDQSRLVHYVRLGGVLLLLGRNERALEIFRRGAERFPRIAEAHYFVAIAARGRGDYDLAESSLRKSLALQPDNPDALAQLGFIAGERARYAEAEQLLRRAISLSRERHFVAHYDLGRLLVKLKRYDEAIAVLRRGAELNARYPGIHYQLFLALSRLNRKDEAERELVLFKQLEEASKSRRRTDYSTEDLTP